MFSDLECDYINPIDLCNKLNQVTLNTNCYAKMRLLILCAVIVRLARDGCPSFLVLYVPRQR